MNVEPMARRGAPLVRHVLTSVAVLGLALSGTAVRPDPAAATPASRGVVILFEAGIDSGSTQTITYAACTGQTVRPRLTRVGSYDNRPLAGCRLVLMGRTGSQHPLCAGRAALRQPVLGPILRIQRGVSVPCTVW